MTNPAKPSRSFNKHSFVAQKIKNNLPTLGEATIIEIWNKYATENQERNRCIYYSRDVSDVKTAFNDSVESFYQALRGLKGDFFSSLLFVYKDGQLVLGKDYRELNTYNPDELTEWLFNGGRNLRGYAEKLGVTDSDYGLVVDENGLYELWKDNKVVCDVDFEAEPTVIDYPTAQAYNIAWSKWFNRLITHLLEKNTWLERQDAGDFILFS